jgi:large subunit ribosomal protein L24
MNKVRKGDNVLVVKGRDKGRTGDVRVVIPPGKKTDEHGRHKDGKVIVTGVNVGKRHSRAARSDPAASSSVSRRSPGRPGW